jgi:hypothetical protein
MAKRFLAISVFLSAMIAIAPSDSEATSPPTLKTEGEAEAIARSFLRGGTLKAEVKCIGHAALVHSPTGAGSHQSSELRYPSWIVAAWGWFEFHPRPDVVDSADGVLVFIDAFSGETYDFAFNGGPGLPCRMGRCNGMERLFQPCR